MTPSPEFRYILVTRSGCSGVFGPGGHQGRAGGGEVSNVLSHGSAGVQWGPSHLYKVGLARPGTLRLVTAGELASHACHASG